MNTSIFINSKMLLLLLSLAVLPHSLQTLKFLAIGDWGGLPFFPYKTFVEMNIGREMAFISKKLNMDFILTLGDNFYLKGVQDVDDFRFKETFESAFNYSSLNIPWLMIAGNHDYYGNVSAQIMYSTRSERWNFPDFYYKKSFQIDNSDMSVDILMCDTIILCGNTDLEAYTQPSLDPVDESRSEKHWNWLENELKSSRANYLIICGHFPVFSVGSHGSTDCLVNRLKPLLEKYNVTAYFSGHDHNLQHIQEKNSSVTMDYFVSGSANFVDPSKKHEEKLPPNSLLFHWGNPFSLGALSYVEINKNLMTVSFLLDGKEMYTYSKGPRFRNDFVVCNLL